MSNEWLAMTMLFTMIAGIFVGVPVSFTLTFLALIFGLMGLGLSVFDLTYLNLLGGLSDEVLMSIPMFILMGYVAERAGLVENLFESLKKVLSGVPGNLYIVVICIAVLISLATGVVGASVTLLGIMAAPSMIKQGYDAKLSAGVIAGGGSLIMIPPSIPLIVMAPTMNLNIIDVYAAAIGPGLLIAFMYLVYVIFLIKTKPGVAPMVPLEERVKVDFKLILLTLWHIVPLASLILITLGSMLFGLATSTEAGAFGAFGALCLAAINRKLTLTNIQEALLKTTNTSAVVMLLAITSTIFGAVFASLGGDKIIVSVLTSLPIPGWAVVGAILVLCHILGWPFEWPVVVLVFLPIFLPVLIDTGVDLIWFAAALGVILQTAYLTPPVALTGYYLKQVVPSWDLKLIFKAMMPFMYIQVLCVVILFITPGLATWLPNYLAEQRKNVVQEVLGDDVKGQEVDFLGVLGQ
jgi:tripartite ATP-independent transporter DctM subunit